MMKHIEGDLLTADVQAFVHQANLYHTFGAGIAFHIKNKFPEAYEADKATNPGDDAKLGTVSWAKVNRPFGEQVIFNMYSQVGMSVTSYGHMQKALGEIRKLMEQQNLKTLGVPYKMGCGLANGDWNEVERIITEAFEGSDIEVTIVTLPIR